MYSEGEDQFTKEKQSDRFKQFIQMYLTPSALMANLFGIKREAVKTEIQEKEETEPERKPDGRHNQIRIDLEKLVDNTDLANKSLARKVYLKSVNLTLDGKIEQARLPRPALPSDLVYWYVTPAKHQAYATFWFYLSGLNAAATVFIWLYF